jgi:hypothetical protein
VKCGEFSQILGAYAEMLLTAGAAASQTQLVKFAAVFAMNPSATVATLAKQLATVPTSETVSSTNLGRVLRLVSALRALLEKAAKADALADISAIEKVLQNRSSMDIDEFVRLARATTVSRHTAKQDAGAPQCVLVLQYKEKLEAALGDDEKFEGVMRDLRSDQTIAKEDLFALAKEMAGGGARTVDDALKKIWSRHQAIAVFKAKSRASGGRSAA